ncbi:MAG: DUF2723 domain-containing protein [Rikenellaceae bacterium]|nr:DUF2723 domain-containing protein [Rikenellaceae bacterium]
MLRFKRLNRWVGWAVFAIAALVYLLTIEPSTSLWDCSEFIATSYKLEVGHPPGAPLFMLLARVATMFAPSPYYVPHMVNGMNALASAFCILFLFWTITHIARRLYTRGGQEFTEAKAYAVLGAGAIGALAYTFTDTFWFSAVEGEVYALSSMFTALVVWLMLCWEEEAESNHSWRWIILIAYLMGLSIGVHILNLLTIPALVFIYYFRTAKRVTWKGLIYATLIAGAILLAINGIIIPYTVLIGMHIDIWFVNSLGLPVNTGIVVFVLLMFVALGWAVYYTHTRGRRVWNMIAVCVTMIMLGFSSYASVTIRAIANPPMNSNNPNNPAALLSVLNRDQYGNRPLIYGASYAAPIESYTEKTVYNYNPKTEKYDELTTVDKYLYPDRFMHLFPRMWNYLKKEHDYKPWAAYRTKEDFVRDEEGNIVRDESGRPQRQTVMDYGKAVRYYDGYETKTIVEPTFMENLHYFFSYQLNYMYWRYFLWNFVGRQDDIQAENVTLTHGNWLSGIDFIDQLYLGPQDNLPAEMENNRARNTYYFLPFILGLVGLIYQLNRDKRGFTIVMWLFVMMGIALVVYFNSSPGEVRERDYVYAGSFYAFSMWIGLGVLAIYDALSNLMKRNQRAAALVAVAIAAVVPGILCAENWDDHDRSGRTWARDSGHNYLNSVIQKEGVSPIIVNYGDNDTFPLWFAQEVDGLRPDIRIMNSSYLDGEWYVDEMKCKANAADGIPFSLPREKYTFVNDWIPVIDKLERAVDAKEVMEFIRSNDARTKYDIGMDEPVDFIPTKQIALPVDKDAAIASGIVKESDRDLMVDTVYINLKKSSLSRSELMLLDMFANFDWKRPIYFTQAYMLNAFGLVDYLQFDGYAYRFVPILTPLQDSWEVGRVDADYAYDVLMNKAKYGGVSNPKVYVDSFMQHNIMVARTREAFARVAKQYIFQQQYDRAEELLDRGLEVLPISQVRFTMENTYPFLEGYYSLGADEKGDALLMAYADTLIGYIEYYLQFDGFYGDLVTDIIDEKLGELSELYYLAGLADRKEVVRSFNEYYREAFGLTDEDLMNPDADTTTENSK